MTQIRNRIARDASLGSRKFNRRPLELSLLTSIGNEQTTCDTQFDTDSTTCTDTQTEARVCMGMAPLRFDLNVIVIPCDRRYARRPTLTRSRFSKMMPPRRGQTGRSGMGVLVPKLSAVSNHVLLLFCSHECSQHMSRYFVQPCLVSITSRGMALILRSSLRSFHL